MFIHRLKNCICVGLALVFSLFIAVSVKTANISRLSALEGERTFFLGSASSQALIKTELRLSDLNKVKGECVSFALETCEGGRYLLSEDIASAIAEKFEAKILFKETCAGVTSYYCYTPRWQDTILIEGQPINLHVAVSNERCAVGAPIIFGGF